MSFAIFGLLVVTASLHGDAPNTPTDRGVLNSAMMPDGTALVEDPKFARTRAVQPQVELIDSLPWTGGESLVFDLFDDVSLVARFDRISRKSEDGYTWRGTLQEAEDGGWFILTVQREAMVAHFWTADGRSFELHPAGEESDVYLVHETIQESFPECKTCAAHDNRWHHRPRERAEQAEPPVALGEQCEQGDSDDGSIIDVLVVYTPASRVAAGGTNAIEATIIAAMEATNHAYENSSIDTQVRLVHMAETDYIEAENFSTDLSRLRGISNGHMDEVHSLRDQFGADMVALIREGGDWCGIAYLMVNLSPNFASSAFSVTRRSCAVGNLTFAHELGHNMGCAHDRDNAGNALFFYSYGHRWTTTNNQLRRSVMAYQPGMRVPHFSNPDVLNGGTPTGIPLNQPQSAHNALSINNAAPTVASFRPSVCPPPTNDLCTNVQVIGEGSHAFSNLQATTDGPLEPGDCDIAADIWFGHVAQCTGDLTISLCESDFNTALAVYGFDCPESAGELIACNDNWCGEQSQLVLPVTEGDAFRFRVGGSGGAEGNGILNVFCTPSPSPCVGDLTGTGEVDIADLLQLLAAWGPCESCDEDLTGNGVVDVADMLELLSNWGACP